MQLSLLRFTDDSAVSLFLRMAAEIRVTIKATGNGSQKLIAALMNGLLYIALKLFRGPYFLNHVARVFLNKVRHEFEVDDLPGNDIANAVGSPHSKYVEHL